MPVSAREKARGGGGLPIALLVLIFALLWLPLGQQGYLYASWPELALGGGAALLFAVAALRPERQWSDAAVLLSVLGCYMLHQFEEHGVDLFGEHYAFEAAINGMLGPRLGCPINTPCPFDPQALFLVNTILVWWLLASVAVLGRGSPLAELMAVSIMPANALSHIGDAVLRGAYNPGLATALLLFLPVGIGAIAWIARRYRVPRRQIVTGLLYGVALHVLLLAGILAVYGGWIGPALYGLILFAAASLPLLLAASTHDAPARVPG